MLQLLDDRSRGIGYSYDARVSPDRMLASGRGGNTLLQWGGLGSGDELVKVSITPVK